MSFPIPTVAVVQGATRLASQLAGRARQAIGFDEVLQAQQGADSSAEVPELTERLIERVRQLLSQSGIAVEAGANQDLQLRVTQRGNLQVENHVRAAEIEGLLAGDAELANAAEKLIQAIGQRDSAIKLTVPDAWSAGKPWSAGKLGAQTDLTPPSGPGNILQSSGGYPNW